MSTYTPKPIDTSDVSLPRELNDLAEAIAENVHEVWAQSRKNEGWTYGPQRNDELKQTPCLLPYGQLPEIEKEYDRNTSQQTLKLIRKLGYQIYKPAETKILWITMTDENERSVFIQKAAQKGLSLCCCDSWQSAFHLLQQNLIQWSAVVISSYGRQTPEAKPNDFFLRDAIDGLNAFFSREMTEIPWYVIAEPKCQYDTPLELILKFSISENRRERDWGTPVFVKGEEDEQLFSVIAELQPRLPYNRIRSVYREVFSILDQYFPEITRPLLFNLLHPLHFPEHFHSFDPTEYFDNLRRILEAFFQTCNRYGLIPNDVCFDHNNGTVNLRNSCNYILTGPGRSFFPASISNLIDFILWKSNNGCHVDGSGQIASYAYSVLGFALQLCDVIRWFGHYCQEHQLSPIDILIPEYENKVVVLNKDELGNYYYGECCFGKTDFLGYLYKAETPVTITQVEINTHHTRKNYRLSGRVKKS